MSRQTVYLERQRNEEFAVRWADVEEQVTEALEAEAYRRAHDGVSRPLVSMGSIVGHEQVYSDGLLTFLLKGRRPEKYRDRVDVQHGGSVKHEVVTPVSRPGAVDVRDVIRRTIHTPTNSN